MEIVSMYAIFFFKQKTAYEMRISDWSSDVCSSDLHEDLALRWCRRLPDRHRARDDIGIEAHPQPDEAEEEDRQRHQEGQPLTAAPEAPEEHARDDRGQQRHLRGDENARRAEPAVPRSEEQTSELQSLLRNSYAVFCLKK